MVTCGEVQDPGSFEPSKEFQDALKDAPPAWAKPLIDGMTLLQSAMAALIMERKVKDASAETVVVNAAESTVLVPVVPGISWHRCEVCNDKYQGPKLPFGAPQLCPDCATPGHRLQRCISCRRVLKTKDGREGKCKQCLSCVVCGDKSSNQVCANCISVDGVRTCDACLALPMPGSAFCRRCLSEYTGKNAGQFQENEALPTPGADQRAGVLVTPPPGTPWPGGAVAGVGV